MVFFSTIGRDPHPCLLLLLDIRTSAATATIVCGGRYLLSPRPCSVGCHTVTVIWRSLTVDPAVALDSVAGSRLNLLPHTLVRRDVGLLALHRMALFSVTLLCLLLNSTGFPAAVDTEGGGCDVNVLVSNGCSRGGLISSSGGGFTTGFWSKTARHHHHTEAMIVSAMVTGD
jgi:hypothetical protein